MKQLNSILLILCFSLPISGQNKTTIKQRDPALNFVEDFYVAYFTIFCKTANLPLQEKKLDSLRKLSCTTAFYKKIPFLMEEKEADIFLNAQDADISSLKTLRVSKGKTENTVVITYLAEVEPKVKQTIRISIRLKKLNNKYLIYTVE